MHVLLGTKNCLYQVIKVVYEIHYYRIRTCGKCFASLFFDPTSSLRESILVDTFVYFSSLYPRFASLFYLSLLSTFWSCILALWVFFNRIKLNRTMKSGRYRLTFSPFRTPYGRISILWGIFQYTGVAMTSQFLAIYLPSASVHIYWTNMAPYFILMLK